MVALLDRQGGDLRQRWRVDPEGYTTHDGTIELGDDEVAELALQLRDRPLADQLETHENREQLADPANVLRHRGPDLECRPRPTFSPRRCLRADLTVDLGHFGFGAPLCPDSPAPGVKKNDPRAHRRSPPGALPGYNSVSVRGMYRRGQGKRQAEGRHAGVGRQS